MTKTLLVIARPTECGHWMLSVVILAQIARTHPIQDCGLAQPRAVKVAA